MHDRKMEQQSFSLLQLNDFECLLLIKILILFTEQDLSRNICFSERKKRKLMTSAVS